MTLKSVDVKKMEKIGEAQDGSEIIHIESKGGLHLVAKKSKDGTVKILGKGPHRAFARHLSNQVEKNIKYDQSLFKSEDAVMSENMPSMPAESTPKNHLAEGDYHAMKTSQCADDKHLLLHHTDKSLSHYVASGLVEEKAVERFHDVSKQLKKHQQVDPPFTTGSLELAYEKKHKKSFPSWV